MLSFNKFHIFAISETLRRFNHQVSGNKLMQAFLFLQFFGDFLTVRQVNDSGAQLFNPSYQHYALQ